jgi:hypothetical protein
MFTPDRVTDVDYPVRFPQIWGSRLVERKVAPPAKPSREGSDLPTECGGQGSANNVAASQN